MKKVFIAQHPTEAHMVKGVLESHGIPAEVRGELLFGARGEAPMTPDTLPSVWIVHDEMAEEAMAILQEMRGSPASVRGATWRCPNCGETMEPQFGLCWQCGSPRPGA